MLKAFVTTAIILSSIQLLAQVKSYNIILAGNEIGTITAIRTEISGAHHYDIKSEVHFKVLWKKYHRTTDNELVHKGDQILSSYSNIRMNDVLEDSAALHLNKKGEYEIYIEPEREVEMDNISIIFPAALLYFKEPKGVNEIFSERFLEHCSIKSKSEGKYVLELPNGKENVYTYVNGELQEVFVDRNWFNLRFIKN